MHVWHDQGQNKHLTSVWVKNGGGLPNRRPTFRGKYAKISEYYTHYDTLIRAYKCPPEKPVLGPPILCVHPAHAQKTAFGSREIFTLIDRRRKIQPKWILNCCISQDTY